MNDTRKKDKGIPGNGGEYTAPDRPDFTGALEFSGATPICSKCKIALQPHTTNGEGVCLPCADEAKYFWCWDCAGLARYNASGPPTHINTLIDEGKGNDHIPYAEGETDADVEPNYMDKVLAEVAAGIDVDTIAERDGWTGSAWERFYDARGRGEACPDCGRDIGANDSTEDGVCLPCADRATYFWCAVCGALAAKSDIIGGRELHRGAGGGNAPERDSDHAPVGDYEHQLIQAGLQSAPEPLDDTERFIAGVVTGRGVEVLLDEGETTRDAIADALGESIQYSETYGLFVDVARAAGATDPDRIARTVLEEHGIAEDPDSTEPYSDTVGWALGTELDYTDVYTLLRKTYDLSKPKT